MVDFPYKNVEVRVNQEDLSPLMYTTGYVARKLSVYFQCLDRGGLIYPSNLLFNIIQCSYSIFNMCVSSSLECSFIKQTLVNTIEQIYQIVMTF